MASVATPRRGQHGASGHHQHDHCVLGEADTQSKWRLARGSALDRRHL